MSCIWNSAELAAWGWKALSDGGEGFVEQVTDNFDWSSEQISLLMVYYTTCFKNYRSNRIWGLALQLSLQTEQFHGLSLTFPLLGILFLDTESRNWFLLVGNMAPMSLVISNQWSQTLWKGKLATLSTLVVLLQQHLTTQHPNTNPITFHRSRTCFAKCLVPPFPVLRLSKNDGKWKSSENLR